eukprot:Pgem_evm1s2737
MYNIYLKISKTVFKKYVVCGSISTHPPCIPQGQVTFEKGNTIPWPSDSSVEEFYYLEQAKLLAEAGADCIFLEMMKTPDHVPRCLKGATSVGLPVVL